MKKYIIFFVIFVAVLSLASTFSDKKNIYFIHDFSVVKRTKEFVESYDNGKFVCLFSETLDHDYFFQIKYFDEYPEELLIFLNSNNKFIQIGDNIFPLITGQDMLLEWNNKGTGRKEGEVTVSSMPMNFGYSFLGSKNSITFFYNNAGYIIGKLKN